MNKKELEKIKQKALEDHIPIIMDDTLEVIEENLKQEKPEKILEIGTAVGYSAICFTEFLAEKGTIDTIERDEQRIEESLRMIKPNGIIFADNILYKGYVMSNYNKHKQRTAVRNLREYIKEVSENPNLETEILEVGDGLAISKIKEKVEI